MSLDNQSYRLHSESFRKLSRGEKMKKIVSLLLVVLTALACVGCGGDDKKSEGVMT